jgi:hypothetical protein
VELKNLTFENELRRNRDSNVKFAPLVHQSKRRLQPEFGKIDANQKASAVTHERSECVTALRRFSQKWPPVLGQKTCSTKEAKQPFVGEARNGCLAATVAVRAGVGEVGMLVGALSAVCSQLLPDAYGQHQHEGCQRERKNELGFRHHAFFPSVVLGNGKGAGRLLGRQTALGGSIIRLPCVIRPTHERAGLFRER